MSALSNRYEAGFSRSWVGEREKRPAATSLSYDAIKVLNFASVEARKAKDKRIRNEHLLMGLLCAEGSKAAQILNRSGLTIDSVRSRVASLGEHRSPSQEGKRWWRSLFAGTLARSDKENVLRTVLELAGKGQSRKALKLLDNFIAEPGEDRASRIKKLAPHAVTIAYAIGDF